MTVHGFDKGGNVLAFKGDKAKNIITLDKDYRNMTHGYYTTSPASQGKSVDKVIVMQSSASGKASSKEQFYVSASRGKFSISVYTDDKQYLLKSVKQSTTRTTAMKWRLPRKICGISTSARKIFSKWQFPNQKICGIRVRNISAM